MAADQDVEQANPPAADLLRLCAFLDPDAIPESLIAAGASALGAKLKSIAADSIKLNEASQVLLTYSLVRRNPSTQTLAIHRLVQAVLKDSMEPKTRRQWAERTVRAVNIAFPKVKDVRWRPYDTCYSRQQYLPHAQVCAALIEEWNMHFPEAAELLMRAVSQNAHTIHKPSVIPLDYVRFSISKMFRDFHFIGL